MRTKTLFSIFLFLLTFGSIPIVHGQSRVFFIQMNMAYDPVTKENKITLIKRTNLSKSLRQNFKDDFVSDNYLEVEFFENTTLVKSYNIQHPLIKTFEVWDGTKFGRVETSIQNADFFIRVPVKVARNRIVIYEKRPNLPRVEKIQINL